MTTKEILLLVFALIWIVLAVFLLAQWMKAPVAVAVVKNVGQVEVLVAATDIVAEKPLTDKDVYWKKIPETQVQADDIKRGDNYIGRPTLIALHKDQNIKSNYLVPLQAGRMAQLIGAGNYAMTVNLDKNHDDNTFIMPGDKVDVFLTRPVTNADSNKPNSEFVTQRLVGNVRVLAVDNVMIQGAQPATKTTAVDQKTLTLEVNAKQAERLALGTAMGTLSFGLHTESGVTEDSMSSVSSKSLEAPPRQPIVEYHGDKVILR